jgi:tetratricopeptide (TPR) repeat protein
MKRALIVAILAASPAVGQTDEDRFTNPDGLIVDTDLAQIRRTPDAFKNVWVRFDLQFCSLGKVANPFFTQFVPSEFANFYGWSGDQPIWRKESYDDVFGTLFMHKENPKVDGLYQLRLYDRVRVTAVVRNVFQETPWIEVMAFEKTGSKVDTPTLSHLFRAELHMQRREWNRAIAELSLAPAGGKPNHVLAAVNQNLGLCYLRIGEAEKAQRYLGEATRLDQDDRALQALAQVARENPRQELDKDVDPAGMGEADRPMWEAFDEDSRPGLRQGLPAQPQR